MFRKYLFVAFWLSTVTPSKAQDTNPVHWSYSLVKKADNKYDAHMTATVDPNWHIYAQVQPATAISVPTKFTFGKNPLFALSGPVRELGTIEKQKDATAGIEQNMYEKSVDFVQLIIFKGSAKTNISGTVTYQACTGEMCLPPKTVPFSIPVKE